MLGQDVRQPHRRAISAATVVPEQSIVEFADADRRWFGGKTVTGGEARGGACRQGHQDVAAGDESRRCVKIRQSHGNAAFDTASTQPHLNPIYRRVADHDANMWPCQEIIERQVYVQHSQRMIGPHDAGIGICKKRPAAYQCMVRLQSRNDDIYLSRCHLMHHVGAEWHDFDCKRGRAGCDRL